MNFDYDENLSANPFYKALQLHHQVLLQAAAQESWVICIPRAGYFDRKANFPTDFVLRHILVENSDLACHYTNLLGSNVILDEKQVVLVASRTQSQSQQRCNKKTASILFEEVVYRTDAHCGLSKFKLWCLDRPIPQVLGEEDPEADAGTMAEPIQYHRIQSYEEAARFLDSELVKSKFILQRVQKLCQEFVAVQRHIPTVDMLHKSTKLLLNRVWSVLLSSNGYVKKLCKEDPNYAKMLKLAVENYATHFVNRFLLDQIAVLEPGQCELVNRKIVNLHASLSETDEAGDVVELTRLVADQLLEMDARSTVYDKLAWFKDILKTISTCTAQPTLLMRSSDEVLEILVDAMVRGRSMNWHQTVVLLKRFQFAEGANDSSELSYLVTTLEAAQQWILQEKLLNETPRGITAAEELDKGRRTAVEIPTFQSKREFLAFLFHKIRTRDEETVLELVNLLTSADELKQKLVAKDLCHPLCDCAKCQLKVLAETPTIATQDEVSGCTCVHLVAKYGLVNAMRRILAEEKRGELEAYHRLKNARGESPLHVAGKYGQQNILLLLLHHDHGVNLNLVDMQGNSVLHLATRMGHLNCVKALLYFAEHKQLRALQVNGKNYVGDTSLHLAARAGFKGIVETLLEFTASKAAKNNHGKTAADVAFSSALQETIKDDGWDRVAFDHKLKGLEQRLDPQQVELVLKSIERGDVNLALHYLKVNSSHQTTSTSSKDLDIIADLDAEDRVNSCTADGVYPIHMAMKCNNLFLVRILVKYNVDFDVRTKARQETPFHWAATAAGVDSPQKECGALKYVFDNVPNLDAILNEPNVDGDTVLHVAIKEGDLRLIHMLLKFNMNFGLVNAGGKDAIGLARELGLSDMADYMEYIRFHADSGAGLGGTGTGGGTGAEGEGAASASVSTPETSTTSSQSR